MEELVAVGRGTIDGVEAIWLDEPASGSLTAAVMFGVGRADEPAPAAGITHLVEHLALAPLGQQAYDHNGFVDPVRTVFHATGSRRDIVSFVGRIGEGLRELATDRLLVERRILRDEAAQNGRSVNGALRWYRFGHVGHGLSGIDEYALDWVGPGQVRRWSKTRFTRENAVILLNAAPPDELSIDLPSGDRRHGLEVDTIPGLSWPSHVAWNGPGVAIGYVAERRPETNMVANIAQRRARQQLRFDRGLVYDVAFEYEPLSATHAHVLLGTDCPEERIGEVRDAFVGVLADLADAGPTDEELAGEVDGFVRGLEDRDGRFGYLDACASDRLLGTTTPTADELLEQRRAVTTSMAADAFRAGFADALLLAQGPPPEGGPWSVYPVSSGRSISGREWSPKGLRLLGMGPKHRIVTADDGVMFTSPEGRVTVPWNEVVASVHVGPQLRLILGRDGFALPVAGDEFKNGDQLVAEIDRRITPELVACGEHGIDGLEDPEES